MTLPNCNKFSVNEAGCDEAGRGCLAGPVVAAAVLYILPEALREFADYRMLIYAIILILVMLITNNPLLTDFFGQLKKRLGFYLRGSRGVEKRGGTGK